MLLDFMESELLESPKIQKYLEVISMTSLQKIAKTWEAIYACCGFNGNIVEESESKLPVMDRKVLLVYNLIQRELQTRFRR